MLSEAELRMRLSGGAFICPVLGLGFQAELEREVQPKSEHCKNEGRSWHEDLAEWKLK